MMKGYTIRLYPNKSQGVLLDKHFGCARWLYNHMLVISQKRYHRTGKGMSGYDMQSMLPKLKKQYPWLAEVNSQSLQIVCHNLADAYGRFFKKQAKYPVFKKKSGNGSFIAINNSYLEDKYLRLPKLGLVKFRGGDTPEGKMKRVTVKEVAGKYYASILFDDGKDCPKEKKPKKITGLDVGLIDMVVTSHGRAFKAHKFYKKSRAKLRDAQKRLSRAKKGSKRRYKARMDVARIHQKIANQRKDANHKITSILVNDRENQAFSVENLNVKGMMKNHALAGSISDAAWGQFLTFLKYKSAAVGKPVFEVDRFFPSSKTCSACGIVRDKLNLSERVWTCECGEVHHRDINAARNIALEAARNAAHGCGVRLQATEALASEVQICT